METSYFSSMDTNRLNEFKDINSRLGIQDDLNIEKNRKIVFVYCPPKVGSTTIVSSLRLSCSNTLTVIHLHNEIMLKVLYNITNATVNEIIEYNHYLGKKVYVIDIYRTAIEHKISSFFENIDTFHFNTTIENLKTYKIEKLITRFNNLFMHLANSDHFKDKYNIQFPDKFDFDKKYLLVDKNGISYIKLRLQDSKFWAFILREILNLQVYLVNDYQTENKMIKDVYNIFKINYRIPHHFLEIVKNSSSFNFYNDDNERKEYLKKWENKVIICEFRGFTEEEYIFYNKISVDNHYLNEIQQDHYIDCGCTCVACERKRKLLFEKLKRGEKITDKIIHQTSKSEYIMDRIKNIRTFKKIPNKIIKNKFMVHHHL